MADMRGVRAGLGSTGFAGVGERVSLQEVQQQTSKDAQYGGGFFFNNLNKETSMN